MTVPALHLRSDRNLQHPDIDRDHPVYTAPMLRWRTFLLALLLFLSLPIRPGVAAILSCGAAPAAAVTEGMTDASRATLLHGHAAQAPVAAHPCDHGNGTMRLIYPAGQCSMCSSCFASAVATVSAVGLPAGDVALLRVVRPRADPAPRFLTDGIERPPRCLLV